MTDSYIFFSIILWKVGQFLWEHGGLGVSVSDDPHWHQVVSLIKTHLLPIVLVNAHKVVASS